MKILKKLIDQQYTYESRLTDDSAGIFKNLFPNTTDQGDQDDELLGSGLRLLEIYDLEEEVEEQEEDTDNQDIY